MTLRVKITSPQKVIWEGQADSVSSENTNGPFDILPMHANFITIIENKPIKVSVSGKIEEYSYPRSVLFTQNNTVLIYTNI
jgi:F-type H+-transporting ATPase subunit epsilon